MSKMKTLKCLFVGLLVLSFAAFVVPMQVSAEIIDCPPPTCPPPPPALTVTKSVRPIFTRIYSWEICKEAYETDSEVVINEKDLALADEYCYDYKVKVTATYEDRTYAVDGEICVTNNYGSPVHITDIIDEIDGIGYATIVGPTDFILEPGHTQCVEYNSHGLALDAELRLNTATVKSCLDDYQATAWIDFTNDPYIIRRGNCIDITDSLVDILPVEPIHYCTDLDGGSETFTYPYCVSFQDCGEHHVVNVAEFLSCNGFTGSAEKEIIVRIPCEEGCTRTWGYWKTHSLCKTTGKGRGKGPVRDLTWELLPDEEYTTFFLSGQNYCEVMDTSPEGNAYYILAHQYIGAELNILSGAGSSAVAAAISEAVILFNTYTPGEVAAMAEDDETRLQFIDLSEILDSYNNGRIGPGHCVDEEMM